MIKKLVEVIYIYISNSVSDSVYAICILLDFTYIFQSMIEQIVDT